MKNNVSLMIIGTGSMGSALIHAIVRSQVIPLSSITVYDKDAQKAKALSQSTDVRLAKGLEDSSAADVIVLAVKPQDMKALCADIRCFIQKKHLILSVAAGITTAWIEAAFGNNPRVVRSMPNTPALIGQGMIVISRGAYATEQDERTARTLLEPAGQVISLPEHVMSAVTAVSGSGPAYVFYLAEAMLDAAKALGLDGPSAHTLTVQTLAGASRLLIESGDAPEHLRKKVTSPGGTTEAAVKLMDESGVKKNIIEAIKRAKQRSDDLLRAT